MMIGGPEPTVRIEVLGAELRRLRVAAGMTLLAAAEGIGISPGYLSKLENGRRTPQIEDVASLLTVYRVFGQERRDLLERARQSSEQGYWQRRTLSSSSRVNTLQVLESRAAMIYNFETMFIPAYLQTIPYMQAIMRGAMINDEEEVDRRVVARLKRQTELRRKSIELRAVICESALRTQIGGPEVMRGQLNHLIEAATRPRVSFQVVPTSVGMHLGLEGPFLRMRFGDRPGVVAVSCGDGSALFLEAPEDIEYYKGVNIALLEVALNHEESIELVASIAAALG